MKNKNKKAKAKQSESGEKPGWNVRNSTDASVIYSFLFEKK